jgi:hypothetical protein
MLHDSIPDRCYKYCVVQMQCYMNLYQTDAVSTVLSMFLVLCCWQVQALSMLYEMVSISMAVFVIFPDGFNRNKLKTLF